MSELLKICPVCGKEFLTESNRQVYCSPTCKVKIYRRRKRGIVEVKRSSNMDAIKEIASKGIHYGQTVVEMEKNTRRIKERTEAIMEDVLSELRME